MQVALEAMVDWGAALAEAEAGAQGGVVSQKTTENEKNHISSCMSTAVLQKLSKTCCRRHSRRRG